MRLEDISLDPLLPSPLSPDVVQTCDASEACNTRSKISPSVTWCRPHHVCWVNSEPCIKLASPHFNVHSFLASLNNAQPKSVKLSLELDLSFLHWFVQTEFILHSSAKGNLFLLVRSSSQFSAPVYLSLMLR